MKKLTDNTHTHIVAGIWVTLFVALFAYRSQLKKSPRPQKRQRPGEDEPPTLAEVKAKLKIAKETYDEIVKRLALKS